MSTQKSTVDTIISHHLNIFSEYFKDESITEIVFNGQESFIEKEGEWKKIEGSLKENQYNAIARVLANDLKLAFNENVPILSGALPTGERIQITRPPASKEWSITIRKYAERDFTLEEINDFGMFKHTKVDYRIPDSFFKDALIDDKTKKTENEIKDALDKRDFINFFQAAINAKKNIIISGATGSGKTTFTKALIHKISPRERLITIEDAEEIRFENHNNYVQLFFDRHAEAGSVRTAQNMLLSCMRMKPDRVLVSEIRGAEALTFLESVVSGHPGSITTLHANSVNQAHEKMMMMMMQGGVNIPMNFLKKLIEENINIFVQISRVGNRREVTGILYQGL